ncbi:MAG: UDP-N-acetylmuramate dehydrogenase [Bacteroidales bacterium]|nr:UDP-N-acetylmuramate dehydrogenase [Bacteroidales bacterium]
MKIHKNLSLKSLNTFGIEATAAIYAALESEKDIMDYLDKYGLKTDSTFILGGGSNVLFTRDFNGVVLHIKLKGIKIIDEDDDYVYVKAMAGEEWDDLVKYAVNKGYGGLENLSLIPGSVGAAPIQNIGAYGVEQKDHFFSLEAISIRDQQKKVFNKQDCHFRYRDSVFKNEQAKKYIITSVTYRLDKKPVINTEYGGIQEEFKRMNIKKPGIKDVSEAVRNIRNRKLPDPEKTGNAGSFFKNPVVTEEKYEKLIQRFPEIVSFKLNNDYYKLAAGWLIEHSDWKGKAIGHAAVHKNQALVLVNLGRAKGSEVVHLARMIRMSVEKKYGIELDYEVNIL